MVTKFLTTILVCSIFLHACGGNKQETEPQPEPTPVPNPDPEPIPKLGDIVLRFMDVPDSIKVETSIDFKFTIERKNYSGKFAIQVDTIYPKFEVVTMENGVAQQKIRKGCEITIDGKKITDLDSLSLGEHAVRFSNPAVVGLYEISLGLTAQDKITKKECVKLKVFSPLVTLKIYEVDPYLELKIDKNFYEVLNQKYTYIPLSDVFKNKRVDTIYTQEIPKPGHSGEWTFPGRGVTVYVAQEGKRDFYSESGIQYNQNDYTLRPVWDNGIMALSFVKQGFHCMEFYTMVEKKSKTTYTISLFDYWGKKQDFDLTIIALDRNENMPLTGHRLPDD